MACLQRGDTVEFVEGLNSRGACAGCATGRGHPFSGASHAAPRLLGEIQARMDSIACELLEVGVRWDVG